MIIQRFLHELIYFGRWAVLWWEGWGDCVWKKLISSILWIHKRKINICPFITLMRKHFYTIPSLGPVLNNNFSNFLAHLKTFHDHVTTFVMTGEILLMTLSTIVKAWWPWWQLVTTCWLHTMMTWQPMRQHWRPMNMLGKKGYCDV